ncbi:MAG: Response regulator receiver protein [Planctomycetaceae bacterium]|nr:Response regulator receiver protein [Planctomycetaceae bacterium]
MSNGVENSILVVDDDLDSGQNLADILTDLGYRVGVASDPFIALEMAQKDKFGIALLDFKMPGMDGLTLAGKLKELCCSTIIILTTAYANRDTLATAQRHGVWKVFPKPLDIQNLIPGLVEISQQPLVLLVEDDADLCHSLSDVLKDKGYRVCFATEIDRGLTLLCGSAFQVVLIDMKLPGGFGDEVFQKVRGISEGARVILTTGYRYEMEDRIRRSLDEGADAVCYKPFQMPEMLALLQRLTAVKQTE